MDLPWQPEHEQFRDTARRFIAEEIAPYHAQWEKDGAVSREAWRKAGETGLLLTAVPEAYGGGGADFLTSVIMIEEMQRGMHSGPDSGCIPTLSRPTSCTTARRRRSGTGCRGWRQARSSPPSP